MSAARCRSTQRAPSTPLFCGLSCSAVLPAVAGIVLLKNERSALPLHPARVRRLVLVGPHANASEHMLGNYYGRPARVVTPLQAFQARMCTPDPDQAAGTYTAPSCLLVAHVHP